MTLHTTGKSLKSITQIQKTQQLCLDHILMWCNTYHMLINPVKTKSMLINTWQKHQLSDLSLRLSLDGQNIENATEHCPLVSLLTANFDGKPRSNTYMQNHVKNCFFFLHCNIIININTRRIFYNAHIKPHIDYVSAVWNGCSENFKNI